MAAAPGRHPEGACRGRVPEGTPRVAAAAAATTTTTTTSSSSSTTTSLTITTTITSTTISTIATSITIITIIHYIFGISFSLLFICIVFLYNKDPAGAAYVSATGVCHMYIYIYIHTLLCYAISKHAI